MGILTQPSRQRTKRWKVGSLGGAFFLALPLALIWAGNARQNERTISTADKPRITVSNWAGPVVVRGWDKPSVRVVYTIASPQVAVETGSSPPHAPAERVTIRTLVNDPAVSVEEGTTEYFLDVPRGSRLEIQSRQGPVSLERLAGESWVETVDGNVTLEAVEGRIEVRTFGSDIEARHVVGELEATSITGNVRVFSPTASKVRIRTTSGNITYEGDFTPGGDYHLSAHSGNIEVACPSAAAFDLTAKTVRGKLENSLPITPKRRDVAPVTRINSLFGTRIEGRADVVLTSYSGTIKIRPLP